MSASLVARATAALEEATRIEEELRAAGFSADRQEVSFEGCTFRRVVDGTGYAFGPHGELTVPVAWLWDALPATWRETFLADKFGKTLDEQQRKKVAAKLWRDIKDGGLLGLYQQFIAWVEDRHRQNLLPHMPWFKG